MDEIKTYTFDDTNARNKMMICCPFCDKIDYVYEDDFKERKEGLFVHDCLEGVKYSINETEGINGKSYMIMISKKE